MKRWLVLPLMAAAPVLSKPLPAKTAFIPPEYRGEFSMQRKWCGTDGDDENQRLWVLADEVGFYEASRKVAKVMPTLNGLKITYKPWARDYYADGFDPEEGIQPPDELVLSKDGQVLNQAYRRCPAKRKH